MLSVIKRPPALELSRTRQHCCPVQELDKHVSIKGLGFSFGQGSNNRYLAPEPDSQFANQSSGSRTGQGSQLGQNIYMRTILVAKLNVFLWLSLVE